MALVSANIQYNRGEHLLLDYSSLQLNYSAALAWAQDPYSNAAVGQFIYIQESESIDGKTYAKGPYVVDIIGEYAELTPLSKGTAGDVEVTDVIDDIKADIADIKTDLDKASGDATDALAAIGTKGSDGTDSTGIYAEIDDVRAELANIEVPVKDVQVDGHSVVKDGVANIDLISALNPYAKSQDIADTYATISSLDDYAKVANVYSKTDTDSAIADAIATELNKLDVEGVAQDGKYVSNVKQVDGKIEVTLTDLPTVDVPEYSIIKLDSAQDNAAATYRLTKDGDPVGVAINIPKDMMVQSGEVVDLAEGEVEGYVAGTYIKLVLANSENDPLYISAKDLVDTYTSGNKYITVSGYVITFDYDTLVVDLKSSLAETFDAKGTAADAVADAMAGVTVTLKDYAKTADVTETLKDYAKTADVTVTLKDYALVDDVNASIKIVSDKNDAQDARLVALEELVTGGNPGEGGEQDQTLIQKVNANKIAITALETTVGKPADGENPATGLVATTIDLSERVINLEDTSIKSIVINGVSVPVSENVATVSLVNTLTDLSSDDEKLAISAGAVKSEIDDINITLNSKASIQLVDTVPSEGNVNVIYLEKVDNKITEKVYLSDGTYHVLGEDLYASKAEATQNTAGLMSADDKIKLDAIETISTEELNNVISK